MNKTIAKTSTKTVALNRKASHDYFLEERFEAGLVLEGWEVKSLRDGRLQLKESYVILKNGAAWLIGAHISALPTASTHINPDPTRSRKLLLHQRELNKLIGATERKGYTVVPLSLYWKRGRAKLEIALVKGKKQHDKRSVVKMRELDREKERVVRRYRS
ncbi:MAG: SsrA-binding protein [Gammaproteobacteria bacterium]|jgi:SsrA-binding protein|nr:SsrA-binding protein [Gammaproteobacteria bacterium]